MRLKWFRSVLLCVVPMHRHKTSVNRSENMCNCARGVATLHVPTVSLGSFVWSEMKIIVIIFFFFLALLFSWKVCACLREINVNENENHTPVQFQRHVQFQMIIVKSLMDLFLRFSRNWIALALWLKQIKMNEQMKNGSVWMRWCMNEKRNLNAATINTKYT